MSNIPCDTVKDLQPLYEDKLCSETSSRLVEEHLAVCESCRSLYESSKEPLPEVTLPKEYAAADSEIEFFKSIEQKITTRQMITGGVAALLVLLIVYILGYPEKLDIERIPVLDSRVPVEKIQVKEVYELKDGRIYCVLSSDKKSLTSFRILDSTHDPEQNWKGIGYVDSLLDRTIGNNIELSQNQSFVLSLYPEEYSEEDADKKKQKCDALYYEGKGGKKLTIWKKGQKIKPAPVSVEKRVAREVTEMERTHTTEDNSAAMGSFLIRSAR